ncbi:MAG: hypothetical protein WCL39_04850 [Armatimonadota bacterium]
MRILILEDNLFFVPQIESKLQSLGCEVELASTCAIAAELLDDKFTALIADLHTKGVLEFVQQLKSTSTLPVLGFCGHAEVELRKQAKAAGVDHLIPNSELLAAIGAILSRIAKRSEAEEEPGSPAS